MEKEKLKYLSSMEGQDDLYNYCFKPRRTILEVCSIFFYFYDFFQQVFEDFPHTALAVPFQYYFDLIPDIQPRAFSIASSPTVSSLHYSFIIIIV